jgi:hypothetical protein
MEGGVSHRFGLLIASAAAIALPTVGYAADPQYIAMAVSVDHSRGPFITGDDIGKLLQFIATAILSGGGDDGGAGSADGMVSAGVVVFRELPVRPIPERPDSATDRYFMIQAPIGYTTCRAWVENPSVAGDSTFEGYIHRVDPGKGERYDAIMVNTSVSKPGIGEPNHWAKGEMHVVFKDATKGMAGCQPLGLAFHYRQ